MSISSVSRRFGGLSLFLCLVFTFLSLGFLPSIEGSRSLSSPLKGAVSHFHSLTACSPLSLNSLNLQLIPWLSGTVTPLPITLSAGVYSYTLTRTSSHAILQLSAAAAAGVSVEVFLNGAIVEPHPLPPGFTLDLALIAGSNVLKIKLTQGYCTNTYTITIGDTGSDNLPCTAANVQVQIGGVTIWVTDVYNTVFPLVIDPTWDGLNKWFYVAYIPEHHDFTGATFSFTISGLTATAWFRYAINHGINIYGNPSSPITAPLQPGTNLIQLDALQLYSCGDYIAEYSITLYPCALMLPTQVTGFTLGLSQAGSATVVPLTVSPPYNPATLPFYVAYSGSTDFTGGSIHFTPSFRVDCLIIRLIFHHMFMAHHLEQKLWLL
jgi:hypothetical protein